MLGTNDARADRWAQWGAKFPTDYADMLASFRAMASKPTIHVMVPPPLYVNNVYGMNQTVVNTLLPGTTTAGIRAIAYEAGLTAPIDLFSLFQKHCSVTGGTPHHDPNNITDCDWVGSGGRDGCHPDNVGYGQIAAAVKAAITTPTHRRTRAVTISNIRPKVDRKTGEILELGDGSLAKFDDTFYWYGVRYVCTPSPHAVHGGECNQTDRRIWGNMSFGVATSSDLSTWDLVSYDVCVACLCRMSVRMSVRTSSHMSIHR